MFLIRNPLVTERACRSRTGFEDTFSNLFDFLVIFHAELSDTFVRWKPFRPLSWSTFSMECRQMLEDLFHDRVVTIEPEDVNGQTV